MGLRRTDATGRERHDDAGGDDGKDAACVQRVCQEEDDKRGEDFEEHVERVVVQPKVADFLCQPAEERAEHKTEEDAADELFDERDARVQKGERASGHGGNGILERDDARSIVDKGLSVQKRLLAFREFNLFLHGGDGDCVGRSERGSKGECRRKRNGGNEPVCREADSEHDSQDEADSERGDRAFVAPEGSFIGTACFVEQQGSDEQYQE